jgi:hypothetical protein
VDAIRTALLIENGQRLVNVVLPQVGKYNFHSRLDESTGDAEADTAGSARDEGCLALYVFHLITPCSPAY